MKVVAINGSPKKKGNTYLSLSMVGEKLKAEGIDFEIIHVGGTAVRGCMACGQCGKLKNEQCSMTTDPINHWIQAMKEADGIVLGAPVYFSGLPGTMKSFLDRAFYVASSNGGLFRHKVGAALVALRRSGGSTSLDNLYHYLTFAEMNVATSHYWNIIHGGAPGQVEQDAEGVQIMEVLGSNMAWQLKMKQQTQGTLPEPPKAQKVKMGFIR